MGERFETENVLFGAFVVVLLTITGVMGWILYGKAPHPKDKTLVVLIPAATDKIALQDSLTAAYEKLHPEMKIKPIAFPWRNIWQKLEFMIVAGIPPDVSGIEQSTFSRFIYLGALEPFNDWIKNDPEMDTSVFYPDTMDEGNWDNVQYGIPTDFSTVALWYNKKLFDDAGVAYPTRDWTKADLVTAAKKLTKDTNGDGLADQYGFYTNNNHWNRYPCWIWQDGGEFMAQDQLTCTFDDPKVVAGIEWLAGLALKEKCMPSMIFLGNISADNLFISGNLAMTTNTRYFMTNFYMKKNLDKVKSFTWDVCELPKGSAGRSTTSVIGLQVIPKTVPPERKKMAWEYIKYLTSVEGQEVLAEQNTAVAARMIIGEKMVVHPGQSPEHDHAFIDGLPYARYFYWPFPAQPAFEEARSDLQSVWRGNLDAESVCRKAAFNINKSVQDFLRLNPGAKIPVRTKWVPFDKRQAKQTAAVPSEPAVSGGKTR